MTHPHYATYKHFEGLQTMLATGAPVNLHVLHDKLLEGAVFIVEDDDAYFVVFHDDKFHFISGETRGDSRSGQWIAHQFAVNQIRTFTHRDAAIACCLNTAINDAGGADSTIGRAVEAAPFVSEWR